ncbi:MAG: hypothetical protein Q8K12_00825 [Thiobacillus sp.]|nr:hypothetical protein [Thiobacillus sp.]
MSKSLKLMMVAFCTLFMAGQATAERKGESDIGSTRESNGDINLRWNTKLHPYVPSDLNSKHVAPAFGMPFRCNKEGYAITSAVKSHGDCFTYYSKSQNSSWVISYGELNKYGKKKAQVFKVLGGENKLWVAFEANNTHTATYMSNDAQKFASNKGNSNTDVAQSPDESGNNEVAQAPQPGRENCADKNFFEKAACELKNAGVENIGTIINKGR